MKQTPNLSLNKPEGTDVVNIDDLNANMDVLDAKLGISGHNHNGTAGNGPKITSAALAAGAANDSVIGSRTVNQALASPANAGTLTQLLSWLAGRIKAITGATNWFDAPAATLAQLWALFGTSGHSHNGTAGQGPKIAYGNISGAPTSMTPTAHASTATTYGVSSASNYGHAMASSAAPLAAGTAAAGTDNGKFAREGHVHPVQTSVSGNAATATKLATARTIGGTSFDGTANIVPANCTLAASATKLATARTIGGTAFDGTANIVPANCTLAANATKLATKRTIALTGAVTGSGSFDGSANLSIATTSAAVGTRVWVSGEYTPVTNTPTIVAHGISGLDPLRASVEVLIKCAVAEWDYNVGDFAICWQARTSSDNSRGANAFLSTNNVQINTGKIVAFSKNQNNGGGELTLANWRYIFRIWY